MEKTGKIWLAAGLSFIIIVIVAVVAIYYVVVNRPPVNTDSHKLSPTAQASFVSNFVSGCSEDGSTSAEYCTCVGTYMAQDMTREQIGELAEIANDQDRLVKFVTPYVYASGCIQ
jgi:hypothetical protein